MFAVNQDVCSAARCGENVGNITAKRPHSCQNTRVFESRNPSAGYLLASAI